MKFRPPYAVIGPRLYFVAEDEGTSGPNNGTVFLRRLVALDWASGRVSWLQPAHRPVASRAHAGRALTDRDRRQAGAESSPPGSDASRRMMRSSMGAPAGAFTSTISR